MSKLKPSSEAQIRKPLYLAYYHFDTASCQIISEPTCAMVSPVESTVLSRLARDTLFAMKLSDHTLREALRGKPYHIPQHATHVQLAMLYSRALRGLLDYESCATEELQTFCEQRRLRIIIAQSSRAGLINLLDQADEDRTFHGFPSLPAELRECIYEFYTRDFSKREVKERIVPPLSQVSRLVRQESLPLFFKMWPFTISIAVVEGSQRDGFDDFSSEKCLGAKAEEWLSLTPSHYLNMIRRLRISGVALKVYSPGAPIPAVYECVWNIDLDASPGDRVALRLIPALKASVPPRFARVASRLSNAVDAMVQSSVDRDGIRALAEAFQE